MSKTKSVEQFTKFFEEADADGKGTLSLDELVKCLKNRGYCGSDYEIKKMFRAIDNDMDNEVSLDEYLEAMGVIPPEQHKKAMFKKASRKFDYNGDGLVNLAEFKKAIGGDRSSGLNDDSLRRLMDTIDTDGNGEVSIDELTEYLFPNQKD